MNNKIRSGFLGIINFSRANSFLDLLVLFKIMKITFKKVATFI